MGDLDILSYGISMTNLEEVFIRANRAESETKVNSKEIDINATLMTSVITSKQSALIASQADHQENLINQGSCCS